MKHLFIIFTILLSFSCKENTTIIEKVTNNKIELNFDSIKISSLPFGDKILIDNFKKIGTDFQLFGKELALVYSENSSFINYYDNLLKNHQKPFEKFYKFPQKNTIDFGLNFITPIDSISTYQGYYALTSRLPNIDENKIFIFNSIENKNDENNIIKNIDLVVINNENKIIDNLNLSRQLYILSEKYYNQYDDYFKYFYIDDDYTIHIKYFVDWGDGGVRIFAYVKYKIQEDGTIVRYFDQADGFYKTEVEEGNIKNHLKDGTWKEMGTYFEKMYYIKEYKKGILNKDYFKMYYKHSDSESITTFDSKTFKKIDYSFNMI